MLPCLPSCINIFFNCSRVRIPYPFQWGNPSFDAGDVFGVMAAAFASLIEVHFVTLVV